MNKLLAESVYENRSMGILPMSPTGILPVAKTRDQHGRDGRATHGLAMLRETPSRHAGTPPVGAQARPRKNRDIRDILLPRPNIARIFFFVRGSSDDFECASRAKAQTL